MFTQIIFNNLVYNQKYFGKVFPYINIEYFEYKHERIIYKLIQNYYDKYKNAPTKEALSILFEQLKNIPEQDYKSAIDVINNLKEAPENLDWLVDETEKYCKEKAMYNALSKAIEIQENDKLPPEQRNKKLDSTGAIPELMKSALAVCFDRSVGHDYFKDYEARWKSYLDKSDKIPFNISLLNYITGGGVERKTLNVILAGVNVGKTLGLCTLGTDYLQLGYNVLYVTCEMAETKIAKRFDANIVNVAMDDFETMQYTDFEKRITKVAQDRKVANMVIKQYPAGVFTNHHLNALIDEIQLKLGWKPDVVIIDYLGLCASSRIKYSENSYQMIKTVAEEMRGVAIEQDVVMWTAAQTTRSAWNNSDVNMEDTAESAGLPATADFMIAAISTEELNARGQVLLKQIKSRYGDKDKYTKFPMGIDKGKQRWYELDDNEIHQFAKARVNSPSRNKMKDFIDTNKGSDKSIDDTGIENEPKVINPVITQEFDKNIDDIRWT